MQKAIKNTIFICSVILLIAFMTLTIHNQNLAAKQNQTLDEAFQSVGQFLNSHPEYLSESINSIEKETIEFEQLVAKVNSVPLTTGELELRNGLSNRIGIKAESYQNTFEKLIREKAIISFARDEHIIPTSDEITKYLDMEKDEYNNNEEFRAAVDSFCEKAVMSTDEYWNTYEKYNVFRILVLQKSYDKVINEAEQKQLISVVQPDATMTLEQNKERFQYWNDYVCGSPDNDSSEINAV